MENINNSPENRGFARLPEGVTPGCRIFKDGYGRIAVYPPSSLPQPSYRAEIICNDIQPILILGGDNLDEAVDNFVLKYGVTLVPALGAIEKAYTINY